MNKNMEFVKLVKENKMYDAKELFVKRMNEKMLDIVSEKRKEVARRVFNK